MTRVQSKRTVSLALFRFLLLLLLVLAGASQNVWAQGEEPDAFGGEYAALSPRQQELAADLYRRFSEVTGIEVAPEEAYNRARLSSRTTFEAVTHALATSELTGEDGGSLGTALDLVEHLETVHGKIKGARGDYQFRVYVRLKEGAVEIMNRSREFARGPDNTIYHKGYPLNYRQRGGSPSIQISVQKNLRRADIDVDYRSASFPAALFNGHLSSANSDVRAGNNSDRHNGRWDGLVSWWRGFFGLPLRSTSYRGERAGAVELPSEPRAGKGEIHEAVHDFLTAWLVEGKAGVAASYLSEGAFECLALESGDEELDYGMAAYQLMMRLTAVHEELGAVESLDEVLLGVRLTDPRLTLVRQSHHAQFVLYGVPEDVAAAFDCSNRQKVGEPPSGRPMRNARFEDFDYFGATFYLGRKGGAGSTLALLWSRSDDGNWRIQSYEVEPHGEDSEEGTLPDLREDTAAEAPERVAGDPELIAASDGFLETWLVEKDVEAALGYIVESCLPCVNLALDPTEALLTTAAAQRQRLRLGMSRMSGELGATRLEDVISGVEPWIPDVRIVTHGREAAYSLLSIPDWMGRDAACDRRLEGAEPTPVAARRASYGNYYVTAFNVDTLAGETVALLLAWAKLEGRWRIYSYKLVEP